MPVRPSSLAHAALVPGLVLFMVLAGGPVPLRSAASQENERGERSAARDRYYFTTRFSFEDTDLETLQRRLGYIGFELPFPVEGQVTTRIRAELPIGALANAQAYRFYGTLSSPRLVVDGFAMDNVAADLAYENGVLRLNNLQFQLPAPPGAPGEFTGSGTLELLPQGELVLQLTLKNAPLDAIPAFVPELGGLSGRAAGAVQARVPVARLGDLLAWQAEGTLQVQDVDGFQLPAVGASSEFNLQQGVLTVRRLTGRMREAELSGSGQIALTDRFAYSAQLQLSMPDASLLNQLEPRVTLPVPLQGSLALTAEVGGRIQDGKLAVQGTARGRNLVISGARFEQLSLAYVTNGQDLVLDQIAAQAYGGRATGEVVYRAAGNLTANLTWDELPVGPLVADLFPLPVELEALTSGRLRVQAPVPRVAEVGAWEGQGSLRFTGLTVADFTAEDGIVEFALQDGALEIARLEAQLEEAPLSLQGRIGLAAPYPYQAALRVDRGKLQSLGELPEPLTLPFQVEGKFALAANLEGDLQPLRVTGEGEFAARDLTLEELDVQQVSFAFRVQQDRLALDDLLVLLYDGRLAGSAQVPLQDNQPGQAELQWSQIDLGLLLSQLEDLPFPVQGLSSGAIEAQMPAGKLTDVRAWEASGQLALGQVSLLGWQAARAEAEWSYQERRLQLRRLTASDEVTHLNLEGSVAVDAPFEYSASLAIDRVQLDKLNALPPTARLPLQVAGTVNASAALQGTLEPLAWTGKGRLTASELEIQKALVNQVALAFEVDREQLHLSEFRVELYDGTVTGELKLPLQASAPAAVDVAWEQVDVGELVQVIARPGVELEGRVSGQVTATAPEGRFQELAAWSGSAVVKAPDLRVNRVGVGGLAGELSQADGTLDYSLEGQLLDGSLAASGHWNWVPEEADPSRASLRLQNLQLARLGAAMPDVEQLRPLRGTLDANLAVANTGGTPSASGQVALTDLQWGGVMLARRLQGQLVGSEQGVRLEDFSGPFAGGALRLSAILDPGLSDQSRFNIALSAVRMSEALLLVAPDLASSLAGRADLQLRGNLGNTWAATGAAVLRDGSLTGLPVRGVRIPLTLYYSPRSGRGDLVASSVSAQVARGRVTGRAKVTFGPSIEVDASARLYNVDLQTLLAQLGFTSQIGSGTVTGDMQVKGRRVQSVNDLYGSLNLAFRDTQALSLPVLQQTRPYLSGVSGATRFEEGKLEARLSRGVLQIQQLTLVSPSAQIFADGRISLVGRLDLNVIASTSRLGQNPILAQLLMARLPFAAPTPAAWLISANQFLADRLIYMEVSGTFSHPVVRVRPLPVVRDIAVRFFMERAAGGLAGASLPPE